MKNLLRTLLPLIGLIAVSFAARAEPVPALIVVNWAYQHSDPLLTPEQDAVVMEAALKQQGFAVEVQRNLTTATLRQTMTAFIDQHKTAPVALIYFSGHGTSMDNQNYLLGTDTNLDLTERWKQLAAAFGSTSSAAFQKAEIDMLREHAEQTMFPVREMLGFADDSAGPKQVKMIFLDCCRDVLKLDKSALAGGKTALGAKSPGMAPMDSVREKPGLYLGFAAAGGQIANQNTDIELKPGVAIPLGGTFQDLLRQSYGLRSKPSDLVKKLPPSLFTQNLAAAINHGGTLDEVFRSTGLAVYEMTKKLQEDNPSVTLQSPAQYGIVYGKFEFPGTSALDAGAVGKVIQITLPGGVAMKFCYCPPGSFTMGSPASEKDRGTDEDQVQVRISRGFWMAQTECTQAQWQTVMGTTPAQQKAKGEEEGRGGFGTSWGEVNGLGADHPMYFVSAMEADEFCKKVQSSVALPTGWRLALPTEAQWEYACRAGTESVFSFGDVLNGKQANCDGTSPYGTSTKGPYLEKTCAVASYDPNKWGLHDMHGNVREWCADWYDTKLPGGADPHGPTTGVLRVDRGGSENVRAANCRAASRLSFEPRYRVSNLGFRPALVPSR